VSETEGKYSVELFKEGGEGALAQVPSPVSGGFRSSSLTLATVALLPWWWSKPLKELRMATFNARAETVETKPVFRDAFKRSRCLIPMSGYYEWQDTLSGKQPWYFTARDGSPLLTAAGLWDEWKNHETGERLKSCTMIVGEPNALAAEIHDRMPVFLSEEQFAPWLSGEVGAEFLTPVPNDFLKRWPVSKRVNSSKADADDPTLIEPVELKAA